MERRTWPFEVKATEEGYICISQDAGSFDDDDVILLHPEQVDLLIKWLNDVREHLQKK